MLIAMVGVLAHLALTDEVRNCGSHSCPREESLESLVSGVHAGVATHGTAMKGRDQFGLEGRVGAQPDTSVETN